MAIEKLTNSIKKTTTKAKNSVQKTIEAIKRLMFLGFLTILILIGILIWRKEAVHAYIRSQVSITPARMSLDLSTLSTASIKGRLILNVFNRLPVGVTLETLDYSLFLQNQEIAKGIMATPFSPIQGWATSSVTITFEVEGERVRRALGKAAQAGLLGTANSLLDQLKGGSKPKKNPLEGMARIVGKATFFLIVSDFSMPVDQTTNFERSL